MSVNLSSVFPVLYVCLLCMMLKTCLECTPSFLSEYQAELQSHFRATSQSHTQAVLELPFTQEVGVECQVGVEKSLSTIFMGSLHIARERCAYGVSGYEAEASCKHLHVKLTSSYLHLYSKNEV